MEAKQNGSSNSSLKTIDILEALMDSENKEMGITEVANKTGLNKSTLHRIMQALVERDYIIRNEQTKKYRLGYKILQFNFALLDNLEVKRVAHPYLVELGNKTAETIHLIQRDGNNAVYIDKIDPPHSVALLSYVGKRILLHATAGGKIILAHLSKEERQEIYDKVGLQNKTKRTISDRETLEKEIVEIQQTGYSYNLAEDREDVNAVAAPIYEVGGRLAAVVVVAGPSYRLTKEMIDTHTELLLATAKTISEKLGYKA
ncbi:IclR family transcriptional regulator [Radiobacillus sp. PE A8.2]|uniref:IclR family transcriptional regulator n=1 Tax=Radiobacillus sp. PE A8.2 TaxID=3380349 RepID=UPI00388D6B80